MFERAPYGRRAARGTRITRSCPARETIIVDAISKAEEIIKKIEKNYPAK
jgi:hypothetical protein